MSIFDELRADAQPGYETQVGVLVDRVRSQLGEAAFAGVEKDQVLTRAVEILDSGRLSPDAVLQMIADLSSLSWWCGIPMSDEAAGRIAALARRNYFIGSQAVKYRLEKADPATLTHHVVFTGGLVNRLHSPTHGAFDYIRALAGDPDNRLVEVFHAGPMTPELQDFGRERLGGLAAKVRFVCVDADPDFLLSAVQNGPRTFHIWCEAPIASHISLVALFGPTVMFTCGDAAPVQFADAYWYCQDTAYIEALWKRRGAPESFIARYLATDSAPFHPIGPSRRRTRAELGFGDDEIIIATAGNRLSVDMDQPFVDGVAGMVLADPRLRWVIAGRLPDYLLGAFESVLGSQFTYVQFDADLSSLLAVADIFANPFRAGGGNTALIAIDAGAVTLTRGDLGDVRAFVPHAHHAPDADAYFSMLEQLVDDPAQRAAWLAEQQALLARRLDPDLFARELKALGKTAYDRFTARLPTRLEVIYAQAPPKRHGLKGGSGRRVRLR